MRSRLSCIAICSFALLHHGSTQVLVDSIPYPEVSQGFWGIHVTADTIFLGDDFSGNVWFSDHAGNVLGQLVTGFDHNHGLVRRPGSYLIAEDYTTNGAHLFELDLSGNLVNTWTFPDVIGGPSSGIGDLCADGNAVWYTMYYPDFDVFPFAYAYKWIPGDPTPVDTVPMMGEQPYGIALKGDTLLYVTDNLNGDPERIHAYDLSTGTSIGYVDLPDMATDGDQSPRGLFYDGEFLYLVANRQGGSAFAYQTIFIYSFDPSTFVPEPARIDLLVAPSPAKDHIHITGAPVGSRLSLLDGQGRRVCSELMWTTGMSMDVTGCAPGIYILTAEGPDQSLRSTSVVITQ